MKAVRDQGISPVARGLPVFVCVLQPLWVHRRVGGVWSNRFLRARFALWVYHRVGGDGAPVLLGLFVLGPGCLLQSGASAALMFVLRGMYAVPFRLVALARDCAISRFLRLLRDTKLKPR